MPFPLKNLLPYGASASPTDRDIQFSEVTLVAAAVQTVSYWFY